MQHDTSYLNWNYTDTWADHILVAPVSLFTSGSQHFIIETTASVFFRYSVPLEFNNFNPALKFRACAIFRKQIHIEKTYVFITVLLGFSYRKSQEFVPVDLFKWSRF